jgi:riboflavin kinase/FMN adenylyltransferase
VATIGTFDGVHRGHQALIGNVVERAREQGIQSSIVTFEPIPIAVLRPDLFRGRITTPEEKLRLLHESGADHIEVVPFTHELAALDPEAFLDMLIERIGLVELWVGDDFALGRNRAGTIDVITGIGSERGFTTNVFARLPDGGEPMSSTAIRKAVESGNVRKAASMLGRPFRVSGEVIHGAHLGRQIGYPTANFVPPPGMISLADGIYASRVSVPGHLTDHPGMTYLGTRPTVDGVDRQVETNIFDFEGDLYGTWLTVDLIDHVRADQTFDGLEPLIEQLGKDEEAIRGILEQPDPARVNSAS